MRKWLPTLPQVAEPMTIRHLLTHTSGLIDYEDVIPPQMTAQLHDADVLKILEARIAPTSRPAPASATATARYALLALIVERPPGGLSRRSCASEFSCRSA